MSTPQTRVSIPTHPMGPEPVHPLDLDLAIATYLPASLAILRATIFERCTGLDLPDSTTSDLMVAEMSEPDRLCLQRVLAMRTVTECLLVLADFDRTIG